MLARPHARDQPTHKGEDKSTESNVLPEQTTKDGELRQLKVKSKEWAQALKATKEAMGNLEPSKHCYISLQARHKGDKCLTDQNQFMQVPILIMMCIVRSVFFDSHGTQYLTPGTDPSVPSLFLLNPIYPLQIFFESLI